MSGSTSPEYEDRYLMATAESMLRAGHGHKEIERALRRMSRDASGDSDRLAVSKGPQKRPSPRRTGRRAWHSTGSCPP